MVFLRLTSITFSQTQSVINYDSIPVFFDHASYEINNVSTIKLLESLKFNKNETINLNGYTDTIGDILFNRNLAHFRIGVISKILKAKNPTLIIKSSNYNEEHHTKLLDSRYYRRVDIIRATPDEKIEVVYDTPIILKINFIYNSTKLTSNSFKSLEELLQIMLNDSKLKIELRGHVCCSSDYYLSLQRAEKVKDYLIKNSIKHYRIRTIGLSNSDPLVKEVPGADIEKNMRVEVVFKK